MGKTKLKIVISALAHTAIEKHCVQGDDAMPDILRLKEVAEDLALFWGYEELEGMFAESLGKILK